MEKTDTTLEPLKIDRTRLKTPTNFAKMNRVDVSTVHRWIRSKKIKTTLIDGVQFVVI